MAKKNKGAEIRQRLIALNEAYRAGKPKVSDIEYDALVEELHSINSNDEFFSKGIIEQANDRMETLPLPMFSLEKIKEIKKLRIWLQKMLDAGETEIVCMPKYDGISLLSYDTPRRTQAWTRGDGIKGQRSDEHYARMSNGRSFYYSIVGNYTWGEVICKKTTFERLKAKAGFPYKNARNMVAGIFNSPNGYENKILPYVDFVRYGLNEPLDKDEQLSNLRKEFDNVTESKTFFIEEILGLDDSELNEWLDIELYEDFSEPYKIDGIVIEINKYELKNKLGRLPNGNPAYAIAFKREEWCNTYQTKVVDIEKGIGKTGVLNPVILVDPVEINGATVSRVTAYNAAYLVEQSICKGAVIEITRGGDVIPKHLKTISFSETAYEVMCDELIICPSCGEPLKWTDTNVDLVCTNVHCRERVISETVYFFRTLGCEEFEEPTVRRLYAEGWKGYAAVVDMAKSELKIILGDKKGETVYNQIHSIVENGVSLARYLTALNIFDGKIAETTCQKILDEAVPDIFGSVELKSGFIHTDPINVEEAIYIAHKLEKINGVGEILAKTFVKGVIKYERMGLAPLVNISYVNLPKKQADKDVNRLIVCMTGFRDKELEKRFIEKGHEIVNGVTAKCNLLITEDLNGKSSKMEKARKLGINIILREAADELLL